jgi:hypothetical protein
MDMRYVSKYSFKKSILNQVIYDFSKSKENTEISKSLSCHLYTTFHLNVNDSMRIPFIQSTLLIQQPKSGVLQMTQLILGTRSGTLLAYQFYEMNGEGKIQVF